MGHIKRGEIYWCNLEPTKGHEQGKNRPILIIQNDIGNTYSPTTIGVVFTSKYKIEDTSIPTNVLVKKDINNRLKKDSLLETSQIRVFDKDKRLGKKIGELDKTTMLKVEKALKMSLELLQKCPKCNYIILKEQEYCPKCNIKLYNVCRKCNKILEMIWSYCPFCGEEVSD